MNERLCQRRDPQQVDAILRKVEQAELDEMWALSVAHARCVQLEQLNSNLTGGAYATLSLEGLCWPVRSGRDCGNGRRQHSVSSLVPLLVPLKLIGQLILLRTVLARQLLLSAMWTRMRSVLQTLSLALVRVRRSPFLRPQGHTILSMLAEHRITLVLPSPAHSVPVSL